MKKIIYFIQFILIMIFFFICKIIGYKASSNFGSLVGGVFGPYFRSKKTFNNNLKKVFPNISHSEIKKISKKMWCNYGRILADYMFMKNFRNLKLNKYISVQGNDILNKIKNENKPVVFISGHFNNFEILAMVLEMSGLNVAALYRPLNNIFLNKIMMNIRTKYICKKQIPKGISGLKEIVNLFRNGTSLALMIDQRVSEGEKVNFFNHLALTTTIPAQFVKKYDCLVVPVHVTRNNKYYFKVIIDDPIKFEKEKSVHEITSSLNNWLEKKIIQNPHQWIWSHNRWK
tara:strand:+ start:73 stop:933 length:861 start_codon:yes stop_codon:yes gene_type:complete